MNSSIVQIMPAPENLCAWVNDDDGNRIKVSVLCLALTNAGVIQFMYVDKNGSVRPTWDIAS